MLDLTEALNLEQSQQEDSVFSGYRGPANLEPQQHLPGFFDAEIFALRERVSILGTEVVSFTLRAPASVFGWFFETERPWWPSSRS